MSQFSRRSLVHGAAWAAPAAMAAFAAPAFAASASENANITPWIVQSTGIFSTTWSGNQRLYLSTYGVTRSGTPPTIPASSQVGIRWDGTSTATSITNIMYTYYAPYDNLRFEAAPGHSQCWTLLTRDTSQPTVQHGISTFTTLYAYTARYTCPVTAASPSTSIEAFSYRTTADYPLSTTSRLWGRRLSFTLNGVPDSISHLAGSLR